MAAKIGSNSGSSSGRARSRQVRRRGRSEPEGGGGSPAAAGDLESTHVGGVRPRHWGWSVFDRDCDWEVDTAMSLRRWILVYLATGPSFTRWAVLAFYGGGLVVVVLVVLTALALIGGKVKEIFG